MVRAVVALVAATLFVACSAGGQPTQAKGDATLGQAAVTATAPGEIPTQAPLSGNFALPVVIVATPTSAPSQPEPTPWTTWLPNVLSILIWPLIAVVVVVYLTLSSAAYGRVRSLFGLFKIIKLPVIGGEFEFREETAKEINKEADAALQSYKDAVKAEYDRLARSLRLEDRLKLVLNDVRPLLKSINQGQEPAFRCTIHVRDILFNDSFYQLLDYYPDGGGRGRRWPIRFGAIGRAWRFERSQIYGQVPTNPDDLMLLWGMTAKEADRAGHDRQSFACIILLDDDGVLAGILHLDSGDPNVFGQDGDIMIHEQLYNSVASSARQHGLTRELGALWKSLAGKSPHIDVHD